MYVYYVYIHIYIYICIHIYIYIYVSLNLEVLTHALSFGKLCCVFSMFRQVVECEIIQYESGVAVRYGINP